MRPACLLGDRRYGKTSEREKSANREALRLLQLRPPARSRTLRASSLPAGFLESSTRPARSRCTSSSFLSPCRTSRTPLASFHKRVRGTIPQARSRNGLSYLAASAIERGRSRGERGAERDSLQYPGAKKNTPAGTEPSNKAIYLSCLPLYSTISSSLWTGSPGTLVGSGGF